MDEAGTIFSGIMQVANVFAWIVISVMFIRGQIISKPMFEQFLKAYNEITTKLSQEISDKIETAVENGVLKAYKQMNEKPGSGD